MPKIRIHKIIRSRRKTVTLTITPEAALIVRAPLQTALDYIDKLIQQKSHWIERKLNEIKLHPRKAKRAYQAGEEFLFLGKNYQLQFTANHKLVELKENFLLVKKTFLPIANIVKQWYKSEAEKIIAPRCQWYVQQIGYKPTEIKISNALKRWGSCNTKRRLNFSWRLIMSPPDVIDYVIVHEIIHLDQMNHSKKFWTQVQNILPDYKSQTRWLKEHEHLMHL